MWPGKPQQSIPIRNKLKSARLFWKGQEVKLLALSCLSPPPSLTLRTSHSRLFVNATVAAKSCHSSAEKSQGFSPEAASQRQSQRELAEVPGGFLQRPDASFLSTKENSLNSRKPNLTYLKVSQRSFVSCFSTRRVSARFPDYVFNFP